MLVRDLCKERIRARRIVTEPLRLTPFCPTPGEGWAEAAASGIVTQVRTRVSYLPSRREQGCARPNSTMGPVLEGSVSAVGQNAAICS